MVVPVLSGQHIYGRQVFIDSTIDRSSEQQHENHPCVQVPEFKEGAEGTTAQEVGSIAHHVHVVMVNTRYHCGRCSLQDGGIDYDEPSRPSGRRSSLDQGNLDLAREKAVLQVHGPPNEMTLLMLPHACSYMPAQWP